MTDRNTWAYAVLHNGLQPKYANLTMLYLALSKAYEYGDLDFVAEVTECIQRKLHGPSIIDIKRTIT